MDSGLGGGGPWSQRRSPHRTRPAIASVPGQRTGIETVRSTHTMEHHSAVKKDGILPFVTTWMDLGNTMLSDLSQTEGTRTTGFHSCVGGKTKNNQPAKQNKQIDSQTQTSAAWLPKRKGVRGDGEGEGAQASGDRKRRGFGW